MIITGGVQMQHVGTGRQVYLSGSCPDMQCSWGMPPLGKDPTTSALRTLKWVTGRAQVLRRASSAASSASSPVICGAAPQKPQTTPIYCLRVMPGILFRLCALLSWWRARSRSLAGQQLLKLCAHS